MSTDGKRLGRGPAFDIPTVDDDAAYRRALRARLPEKSRQVVERLDRVLAVHVESRRDTLLEGLFSRYVEHVVATREVSRKEPDIFFVTGDSGAGKSESVQRVMSRHPILQPIETSFGTIEPYVSVKLSGYSLPRIIARQIIAAAGHPMKPDRGQGDLWSEMPEALRRRRVMFVHIDEISHITERENNEVALRELSTAIKAVSISNVWPVAFVLSGLPSIRRIGMADRQYERRGRWVHLPRLRIPGQRNQVIRIMRDLSEAAGLGLGSLPETDMPERVAHAADYAFGRICKVVVNAIHEALHAPNCNELLPGHFALAYANCSRTRDRNELNPFMVDAWASLPSGLYLDVEENEGAGR
ncbi:hypothetical protein FF100_18845 [Methylobacterium terricola]|uniref:ORC1/DEAH AAA+ ATPase domain-containing protein n=1 Tax=Methylobacterium terricola TaxID=2583531 RepID=A0A5C4LDT4_9HYPH|nr:ATP-binding protein [Methylobacterium terricola]TNC11695.1 hypothetical protein FF100_18845 [Methylobacterium terricola]